MNQIPPERPVERLDPTRFPQAASLLGRAFQNDPVVASLLPRLSPEKRIRKLTVVFERMLAANARRNCPLAVVIDDTIRAAAILHRDGTYPLPVHNYLAVLFRTVLLIGPRGLARFIRLSYRIARHHPTAPHSYLEALGVEPDMQGQGLGGAILQSITHSLDAAQSLCALETANPRNVVLYRRFGFEISSEANIFGIHVRFMLRKPSP